MALTQLTDLQPTNIKVTGIATFDQTVGIAGTLTYEDVTNIDSVGIVTAREGIFIPNEKKVEYGNASGNTRLEMYHSSSSSNNSFIKHTGSGALKIAADHFRFRNAADNTNLLNGLSGDAVTLYFAGNEKLKTTTDGIEVPDAIRHTNDTDTKIRFPADNTFTVETGGSERLRITSDGKVGIGTNNPLTQVDIYATPIESATINTTNSTQLGLWVRAKNPSNTTGNIYTGITLGEGRAGLYAYDDGGGAAHGMGFWTGSNSGVAERLRITSTGVLEIDRGSAVNQAIDIKTTATTGASRIRFLEAGTDKAQITYSHTNDQLEIIGATGNAVAFFAGGTQKATLTSDGKFGVGITNHTHLIEAYGVDSSIAVHHTGNSRGGLCGMTNQRLALATTVVNDDLVFGYCSSNPLSSGAFVERMKIDNGTGDVLPGADNDQDLGSSSKRWANIYSADLQLSNIGTGGNEVDGSEGSWTLQEAEDTIYMINRKNGKRYKIKMEEV